LRVTVGLAIKEVDLALSLDVEAIRISFHHGDPNVKEFFLRYVVNPVKKSVTALTNYDHIFR